MRPRHGRAILVIIVTMAFLATCVLVMVPSKYGFGHSHYSGWMRPDSPKESCCNNFDCKPTSERIVGDHYEALLDGQWVTIPAEKILRRQSPDGQPHLCALASGEILCFLPGAAS